MKKFALLFAVVFSALLRAQDTVVFSREMPEVQIIEPLRVIIAEAGTRTDTVDSTTTRLHPAGNLSDLLNSTVSLKSYGPGGLSTMAMRGANSMQTPVIWNGINLQNVNNNTVDLSLLPVFLFDQVSVSPGGSSAGIGSGAIGGAITINSIPGPNTALYRSQNPYCTFKVAGEAGSFSSSMNGVQFGMGNRYASFDLRAYRQQAKNNFPYHDLGVPSLDKVTLQHASLLQQGMLAQYTWSKRFAQSFGIRMWVQETHREIPPTMLQTESQATQQDYALRMTANWTKVVNGNKVWSARAAVIHEGLVYDEGYNLPISNTNAWTFSGEGDFSMALRKENWWSKRAQIYSGVNFTESYSSVTEFIAHSNQWRASAFASYRKALRMNDQFNLMLREEVVDGKAIEPVGSMFYYFAFKRLLGLRASVSHNYRIPTFNDLYWSPGGNPDLKAETSWSEELSVEFRKSWTRSSLEYTLTVYNRNVKNMITWIPLAAYWSPMNVAAVWSRGAEHRFKATQSFYGMKFIEIANADYVRSTYEKTDDPNDVAIGKQLIYVPAWFGSASLTAEWEGFFLTGAEQYTDLRFTTRDHLEYLPAYATTDVSVGYDRDFNRAPGFYTIDIFFRCCNVTNKEYQSVAWRPMPGRYFTVGFSIAFTKERIPYEQIK